LEEGQTELPSSPVKPTFGNIFNIYDVPLWHTMSMFFAGRIVPSMKCGSMKISMLLVLAASSTCCDAFVMPTSSRIVSPGGQVTVTGTVTYTNTNRNMNMNIVRVAMAKEEVDDDAIYVADFMSKMKSGFMDDSTSEDDDDDDETDEYYEEDGDDDERPSKPTRTSRYDQLSPLGKSRFQKEAVDRKLANNRSESKADKKRSKCANDCYTCYPFRMCHITRQLNHPTYQSTYLSLQK
jgi:hypothetical protein